MNSILKNIQTLASVARSFDAGSIATKERILRRLLKHKLTSSQEALLLHETLLFLSAYPDTSTIQKLAGEGLKTIEQRLSSLPADHPFVTELYNSGIAHTELDLSIGLKSIHWLMKNFPGAVRAYFEEMDSLDEMESVLKILCTSVEKDSLLVNEIDTLEWLRLASGGNRNRLKWLIDSLSEVSAPSEMKDRLFAALELPLVWYLKKRSSSRTFQRFPSRKLFFHSSLLKNKFSCSDEISAPLPAQRKLTASQLRALCATVRSALCVRDRETDPVTFVNPKEQHLFQLSRGVDVYISGLLPENRQPIESYFGFMAAKNRLPISYGGAWILGQRAEIGVNVFDSFRGGESQFLFCQIMRVFYGYFGARYFMVPPYQFGEDNPEAIDSGAYWFYYRLGFRSINTDLARLAGREWKKISASRAYRSKRDTLVTLASGPIALDLRTTSTESFARFDVTLIGLAISSFVGTKFRGNRTLALKSCSEQAQRLFPEFSKRTISSAERKAFDQMSLIVAQIPDVKKWSRSEKQELLSLMLAKGGTKERTFVKKVQRHSKFLEALVRLQDQGNSIGNRVAES
jgi:hypothetical protein